MRHPDGPFDPFEPNGPYDPDAPWRPGDDEDLCRTIGFWKNHGWPVGGLVLGPYALSAEQAEALLFEDGGDASANLARQLIATKLNLFVGGPSSILGTVADADAWLIEHDTGHGLPYGVPTSSVAGAEAVALAGALDAYNNQECW